MGFGFSRGVIDLGAAGADRDNELRGGRGVLRDLAGGLILLGDRAVDMSEHRLDGIDRSRDAMNRVERRRSVLLQGVDLELDLFGGVLGLDGERLHFRCNDRESLACGACTRRLDGRVERKQRGLLGDGRNQVDDIADGCGRFAQPFDVQTGFLCRGAGFVGQLAGVAHLRADAVSRLGEFVRRLRECFGRSLRAAGPVGKGVSAVADRGQCRCRRLCTAGD